jgi:hypothetical protein
MPLQHIAQWFAFGVQDNIIVADDRGKSAIVFHRHIPRDITDAFRHKEARAFLAYSLVIFSLWFHADALPPQTNIEEVRVAQIDRIVRAAVDIKSCSVHHGPVFEKVVENEQILSKLRLATRLISQYIFAIFLG